MAYPPPDGDYWDGTVYVRLKAASEDAALEMLAAIAAHLPLAHLADGALPGEANPIRFVDGKPWRPA